MNSRKLRVALILFLIHRLVTFRLIAQTIRLTHFPLRLFALLTFSVFLGQTQEGMWRRHVPGSISNSSGLFRRKLKVLRRVSHSHLPKAMSRAPRSNL